MDTAVLSRSTRTPDTLRATKLLLPEGASPDRTFGTLQARFEDLLELHARARALGHHDLAEWYANRIVDEMLGGAA